MITAILTFVAFIILIIAFICYFIYEYTKLKVPFLDCIPIVNVIEKPYWAHDIRSSTVYVPLDNAKYLMQNGYYRPNLIIQDQEHKQHIIEQMARKIGLEALKMGAIEVIDNEIDNPFEKRIDMRLKVYKP